MGSNDRSSSGEAKRRRAISNAQRRALRAWYYDQSEGPKTQADASVWWHEVYGYHLNSSTVSEILSYKYDFLDADPYAAAMGGPADDDERKRDRSAKWEELEEELIKWMLCYESIAGEGSVTNSMLCQRGAELWYTLPCYQGMPVPKWSEGWRSRFKARYKLRRYKMLTEMANAFSSDDYSSGASSSTASGYGSISYG
ncbi:centromere binding protein B [Colletotrichum orchidophilum]|uniref:Centromere binding protein B n=1 Tax=Colletotrichum orchidophilum TaxID=1209926 RepID=A0A1G4B4T0_9PEZI|nr:centromere binding protein B [Colletotrichum orchidophilum]OHE96346.1 centromere binding protein B [Colletotrichum orchidophilum]